MFQAGPFYVILCIPRPQQSVPWMVGVTVMETSLILSLLRSLLLPPSGFISELKNLLLMKVISTKVHVTRIARLGGNA